MNFGAFTLTFPVVVSYTSTRMRLELPTRFPLTGAPLMVRLLTIGCALDVGLRAVSTKYMTVTPATLAVRHSLGR